MKTLSYSSALKHRRCPQSWAYHYLDDLRVGLESDTTYRDLGAWWHALRAAEAIQRGAARGSLMIFPQEISGAGDVTIPVDLGKDMVYLVKQSIRDWDASSRERRELLLEKLGWTSFEEAIKHMDENYSSRWGDQIEFESPVAVELSWSRSIEVNDQEIELSGIVDELYLDERKNSYVIRDHKTNQSLARISSDDLTMDSQLPMYVWGISPLLEKLGLPEVRILEYSRVRSAAPKTPKLTKSGSLAKNVTDYDVKTYMEWCYTRPTFEGLKKDGTGAGVYELDNSVLEHLSTEEQLNHWTRRVSLPVNLNVVKTHMESMAYTAVDMQRTAEFWQESKHAPRNFGSACTWCDFKDLCRDQIIGGPGGDYHLPDYGLIRKDKN